MQTKKHHVLQLQRRVIQIESPLGYPVPFNSYNDPDAGNPIPPFTPSRPAGIHFGQRLLRGTMTKAVEFFFTFFYRRNDK